MRGMTVRGSPAVRSTIVVAAIVGIVFGLKYSSDILAPIFFATTLAILFSPTLRWLEKKGLPTGLALLVMVLGLGGFIVLMIIILAISLEQLSQRLPVYQELLHQRIAALGIAGSDLQGALESLAVDTTALAKSVLSIALGVLSNGVSIVLFLFLLFLMLAESKSIAAKFQANLRSGNNFMLQLGTCTRQIQKQYCIQALSNLLSAAAILVELLLFRVDFAVLWGFLAFVLGFIPNVGLLMATLPAIFIALVLYGWGTALAILAVTIVLNATMDNAVTPRIMGKGLNLPVLLVFLSFLFWTWVFGFVGSLLAIPATLFVKTLLQGRKEAHFLVVLLSGQGDANTSEMPPLDERSDCAAGKEHRDASDAADAPAPEG